MRWFCEQDVTRAIIKGTPGQALPSRRLVLNFTSRHKTLALIHNEFASTSLPTQEKTYLDHAGSAKCQGFCLRKKNRSSLLCIAA